MYVSSVHMSCLLCVAAKTAISTAETETKQAQMRFVQSPSCLSYVLRLLLPREYLIHYEAQNVNSLSPLLQCQYVTVYADLDFHQCIRIIGWL